MKSETRQGHAYLSALFAPMLIYFTLSGTWQMFRLHDLPKDQPATSVQKVLHALSQPHRDATRPGGGRDENSLAFEFFGLVMAAGFLITTVFGIQMALQRSPRRRVCVALLIVGAVLPPALLYIHG